MPGQQSAWIMAAVAIWRRAVDNEGGDPGGNSADHLKMGSVDAVSGRFEKHDRRAANEELVAALILVLIYAWNCAKYRARIGNIDQSRAKYSQNDAALFFGIYFALSRIIPGLPEKTGLFLVADTLCQMNSPPLTRGGLKIEI